MSELNFGCLCQLLCCPPFPSAIAAKLAFMPPHPSYKLVPRNGDSGEFTLALSSFVRDSVLQYVPDNLKATKSKTRRGNEIAIVYLRINDTSKLTFLLSHGNAVDLGHALNFIYGLGSKLNVNIMCYDYSGYGASTGKPLEKNLYADAECALEVLRNKYAVPLERIVLYGQSIGTVPTVHLATIHRVAAVVLHSPLTSGLRVAFSRLKRNYCCDVFSNLTRAPKIVSPTLVIHGTHDDVISVTHGYLICSALKSHLLLEPLFIEGAGHNDCEFFPQFLIRLKKLVGYELPEMFKKPLTKSRDVQRSVTPLCLTTSPTDLVFHDTKVASGDNVDSSVTELSSSSSFLTSLNMHNGSIRVNHTPISEMKMFNPQPTDNNPALNISTVIDDTENSTNVSEHCSLLLNDRATARTNLHVQDGGNVYLSDKDKEILFDQTDNVSPTVLSHSDNVYDETMRSGVSTANLSTTNLSGISHSLTLDDYLPKKLPSHVAVDSNLDNVNSSTNMELSSLGISNAVSVRDKCKSLSTLITTDVENSVNHKIMERAPSTTVLPRAFSKS